MKFIIWGLGAVGTSFLNILKGNSLFDSTSFYCIDYSFKAKERFLLLGGKEENFILDKINKENIKDYLSQLKEGDYLFDFTIDVKNLDVLTYCLENNIHYLSTADSSYNPDPSWTSVHQHYLEYKKLKERFKAKQNTCLVEFGMNPGMVSCFAKQCLKEIVLKDNSLYIKSHRKYLLNLLSKKQFGLVAKKLKVTDIQEVDNDNQEVSIPYDKNTCYSPWNVLGYYFETVSSPELAIGNKKTFYSFKNIYDCDSTDFTIILKNEGYKYKVTTFSAQGNVTGHISTHEEIFTIKDLFTYKKYKPNVHFVYSPCEYAIKSVKEKNIKSNYLIEKKDIINGGESVGVIIQGKRFHTYYFGNFLDTTKINETATILQVSSSTYAGFIYMMHHPKDGLLFPEDVNEDEILSIAKPYLKEYTSTRCKKQKMTLGKDLK